MGEKVKVIESWLGACAGCEISVLDLHETLLDVLAKIEFVYIPVLMDVKHVPKATVGIVSGAVRNSDNLKELLEIRKECDILIALGSCACFGGTPGLANLHNLNELLDEVYVTTKSTKNEINRLPYMDGLPTLLPDARPASDYVKVDVLIPGCGPNPAMIGAAVMSLLGGAPYELSKKSVCDECPREKSERNIHKVLRPFEGVPDDKKCLFEQGYRAAALPPEAAAVQGARVRERHAEDASARPRIRASRALPCCAQSHPATAWTTTRR